MIKPLSIELHCRFSTARVPTFPPAFAVELGTEFSHGIRAVLSWEKALDKAMYRTPPRSPYENDWKYGFDNGWDQRHWIGNGHAPFQYGEYRDPQAIKSLYLEVAQKYPALNWLINNAGVLRKINLHDTTKEADRLCEEITINLNGPILMVNQFLPHLKKAGNAAIVNVTSGLAFAPLPISPIYSAAKVGLHFYTLSLRVQLQKAKVSVFELAPPSTGTTLMDVFSKTDIRGNSIMPVAKMVGIALKGLENDQLEIRPGQANALKIMSRVAPGFILKQLSKSASEMMEATRA